MASEPTARAGVARALHTAAEQYRRPDKPPGCLIISGAVNCGSGSADVALALRRRRAGNLVARRRRISADVDAGLLAANSRPDVLARYVGTVPQGMAQQARDGATCDELRAVGETAMWAWLSAIPSGADSAAPAGWRTPRAGRRGRSAG